MQTILTTEKVEERDRFAYWREIICNVYVQLDATQISPQKFKGRIEIGSLEDIQISEVTLDPHQVVRTESQISKSKEDYFLVNLQTAGHGYITQDNREAKLHPGDFALYDSTRPYVLHFEQPAKLIVFRFPRPLLLARCGQVEQNTSIRIPGVQHPVSALVSTFMRTLASSYPYFDSETRKRVADSTLDLLATALSTTSGVNLNELHSMAHVHRAGARAFIISNLANPELTPSMVAANQGISIRYLHKLFEVDEKSVASFDSREALGTMLSRPHRP